MPETGPGQLVAEYLGGGDYSDAGYATVSDAELPDHASTFAVEIAGTSWQVVNDCPAPLLSVGIYAEGPEGGVSLLPSGSETCPGPEPWCLMFTTPLDSEYSLAVFDFSTGDVATYDVATAAPDVDGRVLVPSPPADGRVELDLLNAQGEEVESVSVYLACP